jgi:radical SAM superfamily enzyme YgiQ (UPF0313 family)
MVEFDLFTPRKLGFMPKIILTTLNARYMHASLGLRYLYANLESLRFTSEILEFTIAMRPLDIAEQILAKNPEIVGLAVYIWNTRETEQLIEFIKTLRPDVKIILGGPEVSYETESQKISQIADYVIKGAGEISFRRLCEQLLNNETPIEKFIQGESPQLAQLHLPYDYYTEQDIQQRAIYVEASRGCPFKCEFCLSALDKTAYPFELEKFLQEMDKLWQRGLRQFKFVDRTFNLKIATTIAILDFFLQRLDAQTFLHFELIPDHLPDALKARIKLFPAGTLQFEIGIQTFNPVVQALINRKQDNVKSAENIRWLVEESHAHLHTDLIFGLPGEDLASFAQGFNKLYALKPHEIQLGILKRLRGTPIVRHTEVFKMIYNPQPPYNILQTDRIDFNTMQAMNRFARFWDIIANSGRFTKTLDLLLADNPFAHFWDLSQWLYNQSQQTHQIALPRLFLLIHQAGVELLKIPREKLEMALIEDYALTGQKGKIPFLTQVANGHELTVRSVRNQRQLKHLQH